MKKFLLPLLFLFLFILESLFVQLIPENLFGSHKIWVPHLLFSAVLFLTIYGGRKYGIIYGAVYGLLFDIVYTEILGINLFLYAFVAYIVSKIMHVLQNNIIVSYIVSLFGIALLEIGVYEMDTLIGVTQLSFMSFVEMRLYPTLIFNAIFLLIAAYPFKKYFEKYFHVLRDE
ncbi:rod shape-determining protein MreD [Bacillus sp. MUM 116]|uniref:rod shape-determining protein MreD n=1 Tax=Bacillus sp. MUM 116 TaxID=1678002 RepID=UPI0008F5C04B|nr:rod shape-determining protein MreD [Bacillus sp. MUM 116]OIK16976.1 rod shape-determining protein MreD [Bacillus sp. MUM 116]